jgi:hypothetical protein
MLFTPIYVEIGKVSEQPLSRKWFTDNKELAYKKIMNSTKILESWSWGSSVNIVSDY